MLTPAASKAMTVRRRSADTKDVITPRSFDERYISFLLEEATATDSAAAHLPRFGICFALPS